jgi:hypothetical protein
MVWFDFGTRAFRIPEEIPRGRLGEVGDAPLHQLPLFQVLEEGGMGMG